MQPRQPMQPENSNANKLKEIIDVLTKYKTNIVNKETLTWSNDYINDFIECKIYDLINIVEPIERKSFKINLFKD